MTSKVVLIAFLASQTASYAQNNVVIRDTLPVEISDPVTDADTFSNTIPETDMSYYGLEEDVERIWSTSVLFKGVYDSNIFISDNGEVDDFVWTISPKITLEPYHIRKNNRHYLKLNYNPSFHFFSANPSEDTIEHKGMASYLYKGDVVTFNAKHQSATESGATRDVGTRTDRDVHATQISANFQLTEKWSILWNNEQKLRFYESQNDQHLWFTEGFLLHQPNSQLTLGLGTKLGWTDIAGGPNQDFQQALAKLSYVPHPDWSVNVTGGVEIRSFQDSQGVGTRATPVFQGQIGYRIFPETRLILAGYRRVVTSSGIPGTNFTVTGGSFGIQQRLINRIVYDGSFGTEYADYYNTSTNLATLERDDLFYYTRHRVSYRYNENLSFGLSYTWMMNDSNVADFVAHRAGISTTISY